MSPSTRAWGARAIPLALCLTALACGPVEESAWINAVLTDGEAMQAAYLVSASADGEIEVEWTIEIDNFGPSCPVAVYGWPELVPGPSALPTLEAGGGWPEEWFGGELLAEGVVAEGGGLRLGPAALDQQHDARVEGLLALVTCEGSDLNAVLSLAATADLGTRTLAEALVIELWRSS